MELDRATAFLLFAILLLGATPVLLLILWVGRRIARRGREGAPRSGRSIRSGLIVAAVFAAFVGAVFLVGGHRGSATSPHAGHSDPSEALMEMLPKTLAGQAIADLSTGETALRQVAGLHGKNLEITGAVVASYGSQGSAATLWIATVDTEVTARAMRDKMVRDMTSEETPFETPRQVAGRKEVWETSDGRQSHFFFSSGATVWWVAADETAATDVLAEALKAASAAF